MMERRLQDNFKGLDIDRILRRGDRDVNSASKIPAELFQIAVFYGVPVIEELDLRKIDCLSWWKKATSSRFVFPFYSQEVFMTQTDAVKFIPHFIRKLITDKKLPTEVINEDTSVNENMIQTAVVPLNVVFLERELQEFKK
jgi:hypothetical protein